MEVGKCFVGEAAENSLLQHIPVDGIVSSVTSQASPCRKRRHSLGIAESGLSIDKIQNADIEKCEETQKTALCTKSVQKPIFPKQHRIKEKEIFIHGNYNAYYGYRNIDGPAFEDVRIQCLPSGLFRGRDILDIGCNVGHVTLTVARDYEPRMIVGIDIDGQLIAVAKKNIRHYLNNVSELVKKDCCGDVGTLKLKMNTKTNAAGEEFQVLVQQGLDSNTKSNTYGEDQVVENGKVLTESNKKASNGSFVLDATHNHGCKNLTTKSSVFPNNIMFQTVNYAPETDEAVTRQLPEYDVILALSVSKWIHLNHGDVGLKRAFRRIYAQLRMGGTLVLEAQEWRSYCKKKKLTLDIFRVYQSIKFRPEHFRDYLLSDEVGFTNHKIIGVPFNKSKGFQRSIELFIK